VVHRNEAYAQRKSITLKLELEGIELTAHADEDALEQILDNLLSNAIKFSPAQKVITVRTQTDLVGSICEISDQGPGLNPEDKKKLFTKFAKMSAKPTGDETSNGLGLSIVKRLAESMGGDVYCRSELGKGATFGVRLKRG
jgi:signal transduction histidine kinase